MYPSPEQIQDAVRRLHELRLERWLHHELFSPQWWLLAVTFVVPFIVWWKLVHKQRLVELSLLMVGSALTITLLDAAGTELSWWEYPYHMLPLFATQTEYDYSGLPVVYTLLYQYAPRWKPYVIALIVVAACYAFLAEPFFIRCGVYKPLLWKPAYSFPVYIVIGVFLKWIGGAIVHKQQQSS